MTRKQLRDKDKQAKAMLPNQDKKNCLFCHLDKHSFLFFLSKWGLVHHTPLQSHLPNLTMFEQTTWHWPASQVYNYAISNFCEGGSEKKRRKKKTHFPNKKRWELEDKWISEWVMKTGMGRGIKARDAQQIRAAEIRSYTFFVFYSFVPFGSRWTHSRSIQWRKKIT